MNLYGSLLLVLLVAFLSHATASHAADASIESLESDEKFIWSEVHALNRLPEGKTLTMQIDQPRRIATWYFTARPDFNEEENVTIDLTTSNCYHLSRHNYLKNVWKIRAILLPKGEVTVECIVMPYNGPNASSPDIYRKPVQAAVQAEAKRLSKLINQEENDPARRTALYFTVGERLLRTDPWTHSLALTYALKRDGIWVRRDAAAVCDTLNRGGIATAPWPLYLSLAPDPMPIATCLVAPGGGRPLSPPPPPLGPDEGTIAAESDAVRLKELIGYVEERLLSFLPEWPTPTYEINRRRLEIQLTYRSRKSDPRSFLTYYETGLCPFFRDFPLIERWKLVALDESDPSLAFPACSFGGNLN